MNFRAALTTSDRVGNTLFISFISQWILLAHVPHLPLSLKEEIILYEKKKIAHNRELYT